MVLPLENGTKNMRQAFLLENFEIGNSWILIQAVKKANRRPYAQRNPENTPGLISLSLAPDLRSSWGDVGFVQDNQELRLRVGIVLMGNIRHNDSHTLNTRKCKM